MATRVASLYAEFSADTTKFKAGANQVKTGMQSMKASMSSLVAGVSAASIAIVGVGVALKKGFDLAEAGAELEYTRARFNRLADGIGTDSRSLLADLTSVSSGMMSQAELMQSAGDLMALGLANTHDEAVRLTRVAAALNMNMNQLVLTLTNQTTMRFDALGVKVDGFKEKLQELEEQGYSTDEAFKEAFLQQAEAQIELVGDAAETSAGQFAIFRANLADTKNEFLEFTKNAVLPAVEGFNRAQEAQDQLSVAFERGYITAGEYYKAQRNGVVYQENLIHSTYEQRAALLEIDQMYSRIDQKLMNFNNTLESTTDLMGTSIRVDANIQTRALFSGQDLGLTGRIDTLVKNIDFQAAGGVAATNIVDAISRGMESNKIDPKVGRELLHDAGVEAAAAFVQAGQQSLSQAAAEQAATFGTSYLEEIENIKAAMAGEDFINMDDIQESLISANDEFGMMSDLITQMGPDSQTMAGQVGQSMMSIAESEGLSLMLEKAAAFQDYFTLPRHQYTTVHVSEVYGKNGSSGANSTYNDPRNNKPGGFAGGADFIVPSGFQTDNFPFYAQSGERVKVTPSGQVGGEGAKLAAAVDRLRRDMALLPEQIMSRQVLG